MTLNLKAAPVSGHSNLSGAVMKLLEIWSESQGRDVIRDRRNAKAEMFGLTTHFVKDDDYTEIFTQTGLDVDGRREMRLFAYRSLGFFLKSCINFAQAIPGFTSLCLADQHSLLKVSNIEQWYLNAFLGIDWKNSVILMPNLKVFSFSEFSSLLGEDFALKCFEMAPSFQKLPWSYNVLVIWKVILFLSTDRATLQEPDKVSKLQDAYLNVLLGLFRDQHCRSQNMLSHLVNTACVLRELDSCPPVIFDQDHILGIKAENLFVPSIS